MIKITATLYVLFLMLFTVHVKMNSVPFFAPYYLVWLTIIPMGLALIVMLVLLFKKFKSIGQRVLLGWSIVIPLAMSIFFIVQTFFSPFHYNPDTLRYIKGDLLWQQSVEKLVQMPDSLVKASAFHKDLPPYFKKVETFTEGALRSYWGSLDTNTIQSFISIDKRMLNWRDSGLVSDLSAYAFDTLQRKDLANMLFRLVGEPKSNSRAHELYSIYKTFGDIDVNQAAVLGILADNFLTLQARVNGQPILASIKERLAMDGGTTLDLRNLGLCVIPFKAPRFHQVKKVLLDGNHIQNVLLEGLIQKEMDSSWNALLPSDWKSKQVANDALCYEQTLLYQEGIEVDWYFKDHPKSKQSKANAPKANSEMRINRLVLPFWSSPSLEGKIKWASFKSTVQIIATQNDGALCKVFFDLDDVGPCIGSDSPCYTFCAYLDPNEKPLPSKNELQQEMLNAEGDSRLKQMAVENALITSQDYFSLVRQSQESLLNHVLLCKYLEPTFSESSATFYSGNYLPLSKPFKHDHPTMKSEWRTDLQKYVDIPMPAITKSLFTSDLQVIHNNGAIYPFLELLHGNQFAYTTQFDNYSEPEYPYEGLFCGYDSVDISFRDQNSLSPVYVNHILWKDDNYSFDSYAFIGMKSRVFSEGQSVSPRARSYFPLYRGTLYLDGVNNQYLDDVTEIGTLLTTLKIDSALVQFKKNEQNNLEIDLNGDGIVDILNAGLPEFYANINGKWKLITHPVEDAE